MDKTYDRLRNDGGITDYLFQLLLMCTTFEALVIDDPHFAHSNIHLIAFRSNTYSHTIFFSEKKIRFDKT
jgi:hypothetical protein